MSNQVAPLNLAEPNFNYMLLGRYKQDLEYYFGYGGRNEKHLYFDTFQEHMTETWRLLDSIELKPDFLTVEDLERYQTLYHTPAPATEAECDYYSFLNRNQ